ncbi:bacitracin ABC transporter ATP-binding protein [Bacillus methanolicus]|uniref:ABC transporter ATP-binding protein n=1 Tax=Bacillus methanolicus TaxID=1471 RepID=UPI0023800871|nr:ABC transporter ATP-binding protein [Bacillus methanolicus]MDE3837844.1 bacitracin ABC transporter ATP-binding protein [Bacillus methanolicus]
MENLIIETRNLSKRFGSFTAVDDIDLRVPKGKIYGFLGPNGAGKSTTIRMLLGLIKPSKGGVRLVGKPIDKNRMEILKKIGSLVESPSYYGHLTAYENLEITRKILGVDKKEIDRVLDIVKLSDVKNKLVKKYSLGMKQRLGIAQALLGNPELLILDEPTNGLDPAGIQEIRYLIKTLPEKTGMTVMVSSHILSEIELIANHVGIIHKGKLIFQGTMDELRSRGESHITIGASPVHEAANFLKEKGYSIKINENGIIVKDHSVNPAQINRELVLGEFDVYHLSQKKETLEQIFLNITAKEDGR